MKNEMITLRIDLETKEKLQKLAERQNRTVSNYVKNLISIEIMKNEEIEKELMWLFLKIT